MFPSLTLKKRMPTKSVPLKSHLETQRYTYSDPISSKYVIGRWIWCGISYVQREFETIERFRNSLRRVCTTYGASSGFPVSIVSNLFRLVVQNYIENWLFSNLIFWQILCSRYCGVFYKVFAYKSFCWSFYKLALVWRYRAISGQSRASYR